MATRRGAPRRRGRAGERAASAFRCHTANVKNDADEAFLDVREGDVLRSGLKLATTAQAATAPLTGLTLAATRSLARRDRNAPSLNPLLT